MGVKSFYFFQTIFHGKMHIAHHQKLFMVSILSLLLFLSTLSKAIAQQRTQTNIRPGFSLKPNTINSSLLSPSGLYAFGFYQQGNGYRVGIFIAGIPKKTVVWTAKRDELPPVSGDVTLVFNTDSGFVLQSPQGENIHDVIPIPQAASASFSDSANFVLYNSEGAIIWRSFDEPTDTLLPTQRLQAGKELVSSTSEADKSSGIFRLKMQNDGNLVQYPVKTEDTAGYAYYSSDTDGRGDNVTLNLDRDGYAYLLNSTGFIISNITKGGYPIEDAIYMFRVDPDGIFRLYSYNLTRKENWSVLESSTEDKCTPKGICGLNSYCVLNDVEASCVCLPGFLLVSPLNSRNGCKRNSITTESCGGDGKASIKIQELSNTYWQENTYSYQQSSLKEDCEQACLKDCNCDAAFFKNGQCKLQRLPLRYGRRDLGDSNIALIKVGPSISINQEGGASHQQKKKREIGKGILIACGSIVGLGFLTLIILGVLMYRYHRWAYERISSKGLVEEVGPQSFSYAELEEATDGFKEEIGRGSFGTVYKGLIRSSQKVMAVKKLENVLKEGEREFQTEMRVIGKTHHKNLVRLLGYCNEGPHRLLVYEFMSNGSLANVLFFPERRPCFNERVEIARNIAKGILYLHEECEMQIIHCDIKPENILMDEFRCPKISDFGLAKLLKQEQTKTITGIRGTKGYVAPEWHRNMPVTVKVDVYSFGVVLLEIACCRKNVKNDSVPEEECILTEWVYDCFMSGEIQKLNGEEDTDRRQMERMIKVGLWCTLDEPSLRPSMKKVLLMLEGTVDIPVPPSPTSYLTSI